VPHTRGVHCLRRGQRMIGPFHGHGRGRGHGHGWRVHRGRRRQRMIGHSHGHFHGDGHGILRFLSTECFRCPGACVAYVGMKRWAGMIFDVCMCDCVDIFGRIEVYEVYLRCRQQH
jgi:hypothetical protein